MVFDVERSIFLPSRRVYYKCYIKIIYEKKKLKFTVDAYISLYSDSVLLVLHDYSKKMQIKFHEILEGVK